MFTIDDAQTMEDTRKQSQQQMEAADDDESTTQTSKPTVTSERSV